MKANRKFVEGDEAVSAVIGVILMVAITVAIAATVYVYVSGMIGGGTESTPSMAFARDNANDKIYVTSSATGIAWSDVSIKMDDATATATMNGTAYVTAATFTTADNFGATGNVEAGDYFEVNSTTADGDVEITLRYDPTNSLIGSWTVNV